jgi:hypothetical protein
LYSTSATIDVLKNWGDSNLYADQFEYRFSLSGVAYFGDLQGDYSNSQLGGYLLEKPIKLWKAGHSYDDYPQELVAWFRAPTVELKATGFSSSGIPHAEVATNIAALLTLFLRRLVVPIGPASINVRNYPLAEYIPNPFPLPLLTSTKKSNHWPKFPPQSIYGEFGSPAVPVIHKQLGDFLEAIGTHPNATGIISACQIYHRAMELLFTSPDASYIFFICATEAISKLDSQPKKRTDAELLQHHLAESIMQKLRALGHGIVDARKATLEIAEQFRSKSPSDSELFEEFFLKFSKGHFEEPILGASKDLLDVKDVGGLSDVEKIKRAYEARCKFVHSANQLDDSALMDVKNGVSIKAMFELMIEGDAAPSILWLERIVSHSFKSYILKSNC